MSSGNQEKLVRDFQEYVKKMVSYTQAISILHWDMRTQAPRKGMEARAQLISVLAGEHFSLSTAPQFGEYLEALSDPAIYNTLDPILQGTVRECKKDYERSRKLPPHLYKEFVLLTNQAETIWEEAREKSDFSLFRPYLEKIVQMSIQFVDYWGYEGNKYNTLLDIYEPGMTVDQLDQMFAALREKTVPLVSAIAASPHKPDSSCLTQSFALAEQEAFSRYILEQIGYDFQAGRIDRSVHPFATGFAPTDVRITTRYDQNHFNVALFSCIHEAGHAIYEQNISMDLFGTPLCDGASMGIHESQSRFWENMVGRSRGFWDHFYPDLLKAFPAQFSGVSIEQFYGAINEVTPSMIRVEADELTYNLHIMIRYEIEKGLINQTIEVGELPQIWNAKMKEYLDIVPQNDSDGVLQDVHWSGGSFGYFPTYSLGNVYAAQFAHTMKQQISGYEQLIANGQFEPIRSWLKKNIHQYGKLKSPSQLVQDVTGESVNADYLVDYLQSKYKAIYQL
ncbi:carboxypeptidase M32 [Brevibacillus humidisoli]|uniref:carboxypeptidase M32 n=1 Tax=Brevibacillus humidisoli TaxID=2895522 RepID=UPI001E59C0C8|nr:carboxypeptidase M32 [Brevibacillus humidisoli]UFJ43004.1 carboxypeptidase M32 [Brevibacillus humidisoli]